MSQASAFTFSEAEVDRLLGYLEFTPEDAARIRACADSLGGELPRIAQELYAHVLEVPALAELLEGHLDQCRLKQSTYLKQLLEAQVDTFYAAGRAWVGEVHRQIGVEPKWYVASYCYLERLLLAAIRRLPAVEEDPALALEISCSLRKLICFDMIAAIDAYSRAQHELRDRRERLLEDLSRPVVLDLGEGIAITPLVGALDEARVLDLKGCLLQTFARGTTTLLIDLSRLPALDLDTGELLFGLIRELESPEMRIWVVGLSPLLARALETMPGIADGVQSYPTLAEAVGRARAKV